MKKLFSTAYSDGILHLSLLLLRLGMGGLMIHHGYDKLVHFHEYKKNFINFLQMGPSISLGLTIFAEFFCAIFVAAGLFTRAACVPLIIAMCVALFKAHDGQILGDGEHAALFLTGYLFLLLVGPGKYSLDRIAE